MLYTRNYIILLFTLLLICVSYTNLYCTEEINNYKEQFDDILFKDEQLEKIGDINERIEVLKNDNREVFFYDKEWEPTTLEKAEYISSIKHLKDDFYLIKDYFITGQRQFAGVYRAVNKTVNWSTFYSTEKDQAREIGKMVYFLKIGLIDYIQFHKWTNWEKGYHESKRINIEDFQISLGTEFRIRNTSTIKVVELLNQKKENIIYNLPNYFGGIKVVYTPDLTFLFRNNAIKLINDSIYLTKFPENTKGSFPTTLNTRNSINNIFKRKTNLGSITIKYTTGSCNDTDINSFLLESSDGQILIEGLLNTELFLTDSNGDGSDEIYLFSFRSCDNSLRILCIK